MVQAGIIIFISVCCYFGQKNLTYKAVCFTITIHWKTTPGTAEHLSERISFKMYIKKEGGKCICITSCEGSEAMESTGTMK